MVLLFLMLLTFLSNLRSFHSQSPSYIVAESDGGLSNRLRSLISHMYLAKLLHNDAHLVMVWDVNDACPGHFLQIFRPLENVTFISNSSRQMMERNAVKVYPNSRDGFERTLLNYDVNFVVKKRLWWNIELTYWERLQWTREIGDRVEDYVEKQSVCNISAMHIRKTDMDLELNPKKRAGYDRYFRYVEDLPPPEAVYLMTDNPTTQRLFQDKYGLDKIKVYANISSPNAAANAGAGAMNKLPVDHRFTTLEHAIVDVLIGAHSRHLHPAPFSSVSELVKMFQYLHRPTWCGCGFRGC